jgi:CopG family nickel-responsive transcriptional regulator
MINRYKSIREVTGTIVVVYNPYQRELVDNLVNIQHNYQKNIVSSQYIHLDRDMCLEVIIIRGKINEVYQLKSKLKATNGVKHISLAKSTLGKKI